MGKSLLGLRTPNKLTMGFLEDYRKALLVGTKPIQAAQALGVSSQTFYNWMRLAEEHSEEKPAPKLVLLFLQVTHQSRAEFAVRTLAQANMHVRSTSDALNLLKTTMPEEFAPTTDEGKQDITVNQIIIGLVQKINERQAIQMALPAPDEPE